jgi:hypothetical protein
VREEDEQNRQLLELSQQILALTKETRSFASFARENYQQNQELLDRSFVAMHNIARPRFHCPPCQCEGVPTR